MRIMTVVRSVIAKHGSFEDILLDQARRLKERGDEPSFVFPEVRYQPFAAAAAPYATIHLDTGDWNTAEGVAGLQARIEAEGAGIVAFHFCAQRRLAKLFAWARRKGIRIVYHYHGEIVPIATLKWYKRFISSLRLQTWSCAEIVTPSHANAAFLRHHSVRPPVRVVHHGMDLSRFDPHAPGTSELARFGLSPDERYAIYIGTFFARKRIGALLEAFHRARRGVGDVRLVIVGDGGEGDMEHYTAMAGQLGLGDKVVFTGLLPEYPYELVRHAKLLVSASKQESFGLLFTEAMALGVPVVACKVGGVPEVVADGRTGYLADPDSVDDLADKVRRLLSDEDLRATFAAASRPWVAENFDMAVRGQDLVDAVLGVGG
jgi:glycosyltransferase involved in cell wall biosynthesis